MGETPRWRRLLRRAASELGCAVLCLAGSLLPLVLFVGVLVLSYVWLAPKPYFDHTAAELGRMSEMQLIPADATPLGQQRVWDGGKGIAGWSVASATQDFGSNLTEADLLAYYDRELLARGWKHCPDRATYHWCKGNLEFAYSSSAGYHASDADRSHYQTIYAIQLTEHSRRNKRPWPLPP